MIAWLAKAFFAVFDRLGGAIADAGHAVRAVFAPDRFAIFERDVVCRTALDALSAADTGIADGKGRCLDKERVE